MSEPNIRVKPLREQVADALAYNDACGLGPVSREEYLADADVLIDLIAGALEVGASHAGPHAHAESTE